jgi:pyruvate, water dikinase
MGRFVKSFSEMGRQDSQEAGGKAANLSELTQGGFNVPAGFCVTSSSLQHHIDAGGLQPQITALAGSLDYEDYEAIETTTAAIRALIDGAPIPEDLSGEIREAIGVLIVEPGTLVAVRSSVAVKGTTISSFPGMMDTYHYLRGEQEIVDHIRLCWASLWTARATFDRYHKGIAHELALIAPTVQKMVHSEVAGVLFTANPISGSRDEVVIESNWGLGESVVSGKSMNDFYIIDKASLAVTTEKIGRKTVMFDLDRVRGYGRTEGPVPAEKSQLATLSREQLVLLAQTGLKAEALFASPQDVEWAFEGGQLYLLQSRSIKNLQS